MKKILLFSLSAALLLFAGCEKDSDENTYDIRITNVLNDNSDVSDTWVYAEVYPGIEMAKASFSLSSCMLKLPEVPGKKFFTNIVDDLGGYDIDNPRANWTFFMDFSIRGKNGEDKGELFEIAYISETEGYFILYVYADDDVKIFGSYSRPDPVKEILQNISFNLNLKKGWNRISQHFKQTSEAVSTSYTNYMPVRTNWLYLE